MNSIFKIKNFYLLIFAISLSSLLIALYIEFIMGFKPCKLCMYQRIPYLIAIFIIFFGINNYKNLFWLYSLLFIFILSSSISGYHFGIEQGFFEEFSGCTTNNLDIINKSDLLEALQSEPKSCKNVEFSIFGFSLAAINFLLSTIIFILIIKVLLNEKNK
tara:strand:- start:130 stop:609 length:480 start_codon:yes stop_codon:yes gene_type:complete